MDKTDFEDPEDNTTLPVDTTKLPQDQWPWNVTITPPPEYEAEDP